MRTPAVIAAALVMASLSACGSAKKTPSDVETTQLEPAKDDAETTAGDTPPKGDATGKTDGATDFSAYVGKYPFDDVNGSSFKNNEEIQSAIRIAVGDSRLFQTITTTQGPSSPIALRGERLVSWSCEQHNCGPHHWTVLFDPATKAAEVCYFDQSKSEKSRWYSGGRMTERADDCPSE